MERLAVRSQSHDSKNIAQAMVSLSESINDKVEGEKPWFPVTRFLLV